MTVDYRKAAAKRAFRAGTEEMERLEAPHDAMQANDDRSDMLAAIRCLTLEQQQVVILRFYTGMSNAEVAHVMGKPEGAVKALQTRAVRSLRRIIEGGGRRRATA